MIGLKVNAMPRWQCWVRGWSKLTKRLLISLLCCLLVLLPGTCSAAETTLEAKELHIRQLLANSIRQEEITSILMMNSTEAQQLLLKTTAELQALKKELEELRQTHQQLTESYNKMMLLSQKQGESLKKINESFETYSKEVKAKINQLERKNKLLEIVAGAALVYSAMK